MLKYILHTSNLLDDKPDREIWRPISFSIPNKFYQITINNLYRKAGQNLFSVEFWMKSFNLEKKYDNLQKTWKAWNGWKSLWYSTNVRRHRGQGRTLRGGANRACPSIICLLFSGSPHHQFGIGWAIFLKIRRRVGAFYLKNEVYLVNIAFASENLKKIASDGVIFCTAF